MIERIRPDGARIRDIVNEVTGRRGGVTIEHPDGRVDAVAAPATRQLTPDDLGTTMSTIRRASYEALRQQGQSHEAALFLMEG